MSTPLVRVIPTRVLPATSKAFTLIELLTVIAVMAVLTSLLAPAFNSIGRSSQLSAEGNKVVNLVNLAGQNSMAKNAMTALVAIPTDQSASSAYRAFALFEYVPEASDWKQISGWETLKEGVVVDPASFTFTSYPASKPQPDLPAIKYGGRTISSYKYVVFLPNRSLLQNSSAQLKLAEGLFAGGASTPTYTRKGSDGSPANYYNVTVLGTTGRPKIDRL